MKLLHYFLGFNSFALAYWLFTVVLCSPDTFVKNYIVCCLIFSVLCTTTVYNLFQGFKLQRSEY